MGSSGSDSAATPETLAIPPSCSDGVDNDLDGLVDGLDPGCQPPPLSTVTLPLGGVDTFESVMRLTALPVGPCLVNDFVGVGPTVVTRSDPSAGIIDTEIVSMQLTGTGTISSLGACPVPEGPAPITILQDFTNRSTGKVTRCTQCGQACVDCSPSGDFPATS